MDRGMNLARRGPPASSSISKGTLSLDGISYAEGKKFNINNKVKNVVEDLEKPRLNSSSPLKKFVSYLSQKLKGGFLGRKDFKKIIDV